MVPLVESRLLRVLSQFRNVIRFNSLDFDNRIDQNEEKKQQELHIYKKAMKKNEVIDFLADNIHYNQKNIIVTHKPYGVGKQTPIRTSTKYAPEALTDYYLSEILQKLSKKLEVDSLQVVQVPERYASGVTILATTDKAKDLMVKNIGNLKKAGVYRDTYLTIVVGKPKDHLQTKFAIKIEQTVNQKPYPVVLSQWPKQFKNRSNLRVYSWKHTVLSSSELASLVKVELSSSRLNSLRLFLATKCLTPILGDRIFGSRVIKVNGVPLLAKPTHQQQKPNHDPVLLSALNLEEDDVAIIPSHVHLLTKVLPFSKKNKVSVSVPPPESFTWTCERLGLSLDAYSIEPNDNNHLMEPSGI